MSERTERMLGVAIIACFAIAATSSIIAVVLRAAG